MQVHATAASRASASRGLTLVQDGTSTLTLFRCFLSLKIASPFILPYGLLEEMNYLSLLAALVVVATCLPRTALFGMLGSAALALSECLRTWPFTINHAFIELIAMLLLCLAPQVRRSEGEQQPIAGELIVILMLSVWLYSGIHKLCDGYYLNGEFFALEVSNGATALGEHLGILLQTFAKLFSLAPAQVPLSCCTVAETSFPVWQVFFFQGLSWLTIAGELLLPLGVLWRRSHQISISGLLLLQGLIGYFSGEIDFAFTAYAILLLVLPRWSTVTYPLLTVIYLGVCPWA